MLCELQCCVVLCCTPSIMLYQAVLPCGVMSAHYHVLSLSLFCCMPQTCPKILLLLTGGLLCCQSCHLAASCNPEAGLAAPDCQFLAGVQQRSQQQVSQSLDNPYLVGSAFTCPNVLCCVQLCAFLPCSVLLQPYVIKCHMHPGTSLLEECFGGSLCLAIQPDLTCIQVPCLSTQ